MAKPSICSRERYDELREKYPELAINIYGLTPGGVVTLEVIAPDGKTYSWTAETLDAAYALAFPAADTPEANELVEPAIGPENQPTIFD